jgi:membrane associated rhomboid family serine protease
VLFPLRDHNPRTRFPAVTVLLIVVNALVFLYELSLSPQEQSLLALRGGAIPYEIVNWVDIRPRDLFPLPGSIFTSMFLHGGWMHLIGNMWFLWIFGDNVEERLGTFRFIIFYFVVGAVGALAQAFSLPTSLTPMIGASGAIAGVLGGYVMLFPRAKVVTFVAIPLLWHVRDVPAWVFLGIWFIGQFLLPGNSGVAWMAHVGGFLAGLGAVRLLARSRPPSPTAGTADVEYLPPPRRRDGWS